MLKMNVKEAKAAQARREKQESLAYLREILAPGSHVYATVRTVARSGMSRRIDLYAIRPGTPRHRDGHPWLARLSFHAAAVLGWPVNDDGVRVDGGGMDMRHHLVEALSFALFGHDRGPDGKYRVEHLRMEAF